MSALEDRPIPADVAVFGEVGLGGEVRQVAHGPRRVTEARRLGFERIIVPAHASIECSDAALLRAGTLGEAMAAAGLGGAHRMPGLQAV